MENTRNNAEKLANFYLAIMELDNDVDTLEWKVNLDPAQVNQWQQGTPALAVCPPEINPEKLFTRFYSVAEACQKWQVGPQPLPEDFLVALKQLDEDQRKDLLNSLLLINGHKARWAKELRVSAELLDFVALNTFKPLLKSYGQAVLKQLPLTSWTASHCPVCGDQPTMAKLVGKEGARKLYCGRCETEWRYKRLGCPYCEDDNASEASFITLEDKKQYRVYLCDHCKSYLKTVDERVVGEVDLFCEDLATADLDELARAEGYRRGDRRQQV